MKRPVVLAFLALLSLPSVSPAQEPHGPVAAALKQTLTRYVQNMPAAAEAMPAEKFSFAPTPQQMTFGEIMAHESQSNETLCAAIGGSTKPPSESSVGAGAPKADLVARLRKSFEYCGTVIAQLKDRTLADSVPFFGGRRATRARAVITLAQDWADHYAQAAMYLRANGILPPTARKP
jgi:hypothetical protein